MYYSLVCYFKNKAGAEKNKTRPSFSPSQQIIRGNFHYLANAPFLLLYRSSNCLFKAVRIITWAVDVILLVITIYSHHACTNVL